MDSVKRYEVWACGGYPLCGEKSEEENGDFVLYADYATLRARADKLAEAVEVIMNTADDEAYMAPDGWDAGNSPVAVATYARQALSDYKGGKL